MLCVAAATVYTLAAFRATAAERVRPLDGDSVVAGAIYVTTQAVTINATPERVWPWLAQMGADRAGWYSYSTIDNNGRPSAESILAQYQHINVGDVLPALPGATDAFVVGAVDIPHSLLLTVPSTAHGPIVSWEFSLEPLDHARTRLIVRGRVSSAWRDMARQATKPNDRNPELIERIYGLVSRLPSRLTMALAGFGHRVMQNRQLAGIKRRAETAAADG